MNPTDVIRMVDEFFEANRQRPRTVRIFEAVVRLLDRGQDHLRVWENLGEVVHGDTALAELSTTVFMLSAVAHIEAAALNAAKLMDSHADSANVRYLLNTIEADRSDSILRADWPSTKAALASARQRLEDTEPVVKRIKQRRDQEIAHLDKRHIDLSPDWQGIEVNDIRLIFETVEGICHVLAQSIAAFTQVKRFSLHDMDPDGFKELIYFARAGLNDDTVESPSARAEAIRVFDRSLRDARKMATSPK